MAGHLVPDVLGAIESGRLSAEEAVRAAMRGARALKEAMARAGQRRLRRPAIYKWRAYPEAVIARAIQRVRRLTRGNRTVRSVHWGVGQRRGRRTGDIGVVVHVLAKRSRARLRRERRRALPASVTVTHHRRRYVVPVDVQAVGPPATLHIDALRPGHHGQIRVGADGIGALGAIVGARDGQTYALTAGHVAQVIGTRDVQCADADAGIFAIGKVKCNRLASGDDIAMIGPVRSVPAGAATPATFARDASDQDLQQRVFVIKPGAITAFESHIEGVGVSAVFGTSAGLISLRGLTSIDRMTAGGDSGAPVLDAQGNVVGFVVGADATRTFLMPARRALNALQTCV